MTETGIIILAHGSRGERGSSEVPAILAHLTQGLKRFVSSDVDIIGAALQFNHPNLDEAAEILNTKGIRQIIIAPYFLFMGRHLTEDIPEKIQNLKSRFSETQFIMTANLGLHESFIEMMANNVIEASPSLAVGASSESVSPDKIEELSLGIVDRMLPEELTGNARIVIQRIVHAGGDPSLASLVRFSLSAISDGIKAIRKGCPIFTDVHMTATGVSRKLVQKYGGSVLCALDEDYANRNIDKKLTRSAAAMYQLNTKLNPGIIAIGNAPTALLAVIDMIDNQHLTPLLVVGMPVGFVQAAESKKELMKRQIPYITIEGTRGGSPLAAATVNALLKLAA